MSRKDKPQSFDARLQLGAYTGTESGFRLSIEDDTSGTVVAVLTLTHEQMGELLSSRNVTPAGATLFGTDRVGHRHESTVVALQGLTSDVWNAASDDDELDDLIEVGCQLQHPGFKPRDGWRPERLQGSSFNFHRWDQAAGTYQVRLHRWVAPAA